MMFKKISENLNYKIIHQSEIPNCSCVLSEYCERLPILSQIRMLASLASNYECPNPLSVRDMTFFFQKFSEISK